MLEKVDYTRLLDYDAFAQSLDVDEAAFLLLALKPTKHTALYPLKVALEERVRTSPLSAGVGRRVAKRFYKGQNRENHASRPERLPAHPRPVGRRGR